MARYRPIYIEIWEDEDEFLNYSDKEKILFMYLITNKSCTESGIYKISPRNICFMFNWKLPAFNTVIKNLLPNVAYDEQKKIVFVKNFYRYNGMRRGRPDLILKSILKDRESFVTSLWLCFIETYPKFDKSIPKVSYETDTDYDSDSSINLFPLTSLEAIKKNKEVEDKNKIHFEVFRIMYPGSKTGPNTEWEHFIKKTKDWRDVLPLLISAVKSQKKNREDRIGLRLFTPDWKNIQTWINNRCWEEEPEELPKTVQRGGIIHDA